MTAIPPEQGPDSPSRRLPWPRRAAEEPGGADRFDQPYAHRSTNPIDRALDRVIDADLQRRQRIALARLPRPVWADLNDPDPDPGPGPVPRQHSVTETPPRARTARDDAAAEGTAHGTVVAGPRGSAVAPAPAPAAAAAAAAAAEIRPSLLAGFALAAVGVGAALAWCALLLTGYAPTGAGAGSPAAPLSSVPPHPPAVTIGAPVAQAAPELIGPPSS